MDNDRKIVLVEDTLTQAMLYQHMLEKRGFEVKVARSGRACLDYIATNTPRAILTDINMPEMSGYELCKALKSNATTGDIIVILLTTTLSSDSIFECLNCGADEIALKSLKEDAFAELIERSIARKLDWKGDGKLVETMITQKDGSHAVTVRESQSLRLLLSVYDLMRLIEKN